MAQCVFLLPWGGATPSCGRFQIKLTAGAAPPQDPTSQNQTPLFEFFENHSRTAASKSFSNSAGIRCWESSLERRRDAIDAACPSGGRIDSRE